MENDEGKAYISRSVSSFDGIFHVKCKNFNFETSISRRKINFFWCSKLKNTHKLPSEKKIEKFG